MRQFGIQGASGQKRPIYRAIAESEIEPLPGAYIVRRAKGARRIAVTVLLRPRSNEVKSESLHELGLKLPHERRHLSRAQFAATHGPDPADVKKTIQVLRQYGLQVTGQNPGARTIHLSGTIANCSKAFNVSLSVFRHAGGHYRGRTGAVHVPLALEGIVQGVFGLDNRPAAKPHFRLKRAFGGAWANALGISYPPTDVAALYSFPQGVNGAGQTIGIIELGGGFTLRDLNAYFSKLGITAPKVTAVPVAGGGNHPTGNPNGPDGEVLLDIEVVGAIAPGAKIVVYFAKNTNQGFLRAINRAVHDQVNRPSVISISWGGPESSWTQQSLTAFDQAFQAAAALGVSVCAASGDGGSSDRLPGRQAHVDFPASSPFVLACGGTSLQASGGAITSESVWNDGPTGGAGGGGVSDAFPLPSWQTGAGVPKSVNPGGRIGRGVPDVAGDADPATGYQVRIDGINTVIGGTSAVAPLMAALIALLNQSLSTKVGYLNPLLYAKLGKSGAFRDITKGNNDMNGNVGGYNAGPGWDACTGFGSPVGSALLAGLRAPRAEGKGELHAPPDAAEEEEEEAPESSSNYGMARRGKKKSR
jgi:kumamolisin